MLTSLTMLSEHYMIVAGARILILQNIYIFCLFLEYFTSNLGVELIP